MAGVKGMRRTPEHNAKIAAALKGKRTPEHTACLLAALKARGWGGRKHGYASRQIKNPTWRSWSTMIQRCTNPKATHYHRYGGRGILIDPTWFEFSQFLVDMGERPEGTTLDRINNDGDYEASNCRWASHQVQSANRFYSTACINGCSCKRHRGKVFVR